MRAFALACALLAGSAQAALEVRDLDPETPGHEAVYDTVTGFTWLADPMASGAVTFAEAAAFAQGLTVGGFTGWRMADGSADVRTLHSPWVDGVGLDSPLWKVNPFGLSFWTFESQTSSDGRVSHFDMVYYSEYTDSGSPFFCCSYGWAVYEGDFLAEALAQASHAPEPSTYALLLLGLAAIACRRPCPWRRSASLQTGR